MKAGDFVICAEATRYLTKGKQYLVLATGVEANAELVHIENDEVRVNRYYAYRFTLVPPGGVHYLLIKAKHREYLDANIQYLNESELHWLIEQASKALRQRKTKEESCERNIEV